MAYPHPHYPDLTVYETGEDPRPGSFYRARRGSGQSLIGLAGKAYGSGWRNLNGARGINANPWNRDNCTYRDSSWDCSSPVVTSDGAAQAGFKEGPWIALGCPEQVIWLPPSGQWDLGPGDVTEGGFTPPKARFVPPSGGGAKMLDPEMSFIPPSGGGKPSGGEGEVGAGKERKWWPYLLGAGIVVGAATIVLWPKKR